MSNPRRGPTRTVEEDDAPEPKGPNLLVLYALLALAILAAMAFAGMIVWPFYLHRH